MLYISSRYVDVSRQPHPEDRTGLKAAARTESIVTDFPGSKATWRKVICGEHGGESVLLTLAPMMSSVRELEVRRRVALITEVPTVDHRLFCGDLSSRPRNESWPPIRRPQALQGATYSGSKFAQGTPQRRNSFVTAEMFEPKELLRPELSSNARDSKDAELSCTTVSRLCRLLLWKIHHQPTIHR
jgi:hypothetical protein